MRGLFTYHKFRLQLRGDLKWSWSKLQFCANQQFSSCSSSSGVLDFCQQSFGGYSFPWSIDWSSFFDKFLSKLSRWFTCLIDKSIPVFLLKISWVWKVSSWIPNLGFFFYAMIIFFGSLILAPFSIFLDKHVLTIMN